jgi:hypothetical protein
MTLTPAMQIALTATPLAAYFYTLGVFHSGRRPRMVTGPLDAALLAIGLGGLVAFGPFGRAVLGRLVGADVGILAWSIWVTIVVLWALVLAGSASLRVTIYHVRPEELDRAVREALGSLEGQFVRTLKGYEDPKRAAGLTVKSLRFLGSGSVEAYGQAPETLIRELKPKLRAALAELPQRGSRVSHAMFGLACLTMLVPVSSFFLANPRAKEALRMLMQSLRWW